MILGLFVGSAVGFFTAALMSMAKDDGVTIVSDPHVRTAQVNHLEEALHATEQRAVRWRKRFFWLAVVASDEMRTPEWYYEQSLKEVPDV